MSAATAATVALNDGNQMPQLGYGVWQIEDSQAARLVQLALQAGYRNIDTARVYDNETGVGQGLRASGLAREEFFVTTKLWNTRHAYDEALRAFDASAGRLQLDVIDLYLIHWPAPWQDRYVEAWRALVRLREEGRVRSIGVSNFHRPHLERIIDDSGVVPAVNQVELHPYLQQRQLRSFHAEHDIATEAWSPLGQGGPLLADPVLARIAAQHDRTPAQVVLRWHLQSGVAAIPKSATPERIVQNAQLDGFVLSDADMESIASLDCDGRIGPDPDTAQF